MRKSLLLFSLVLISCNQKQIVEPQLKNNNADFTYPSYVIEIVENDNNLKSKDLEKYEKAIKSNIAIYEKYSKKIKIKKTDKAIHLLRLALLYHYQNKSYLYNKYLTEASEIYGVNRSDSADRYMLLYVARFNTNIGRAFNEFLKKSNEELELEWLILSEKAENKEFNKK